MRRNHKKTSQEVFRIEKILRKKQINDIEHGLVKWIGYSDKFNKWMPVSRINSTKRIQYNIEWYF